VSYSKPPIPKYSKIGKVLHYLGILINFDVFIDIVWIKQYKYYLYVKRKVSLY